MMSITIILNLLCGLLVLATGIIYLKNTLVSTKTVNKENTSVQDILKEFKVDFFKFLLVAFISIVCPILVKDIDLSSVTDALFLAFVITGTVESIHYLLKGKITDNTSYVKYYKFVAVIILGILNGILI
jgi:uncharacterized protein YybS (DUF2232 family)